MTRLRMRVADRLKGAQNTYAMLSTFNEIDMTGLMQLRSDYKVWVTDCGMSAWDPHFSFILLVHTVHSSLAVC